MEIGRVEFGTPMGIKVRLMNDHDSNVHIRSDGTAAFQVSAGQNPGDIVVNVDPSGSSLYIFDGTYWRDCGRSAGFPLKAYGKGVIKFGPRSNLTTARKAVRSQHPTPTSNDLIIAPDGADKWLVTNYVPPSGRHPAGFWFGPPMASEFTIPPAQQGLPRYPDVTGSPLWPAV